MRLLIALALTGLLSGCYSNGSIFPPKEVKGGSGPFIPAEEIRAPDGCYQGKKEGRDVDC